MVDIIHGLPEGMEDAAAALYWQAFGEKFGKLLGPDARALRFFSGSINRKAILAAVEGDTLLGIAAFQVDNKGFSTAGAGEVFKHYGLGALWRLPLLALLEREPPEGTLQMDGICVGDAARGKGVGTALLEALFARAKSDGFSHITLDVIDTNPRAKALYERLGFEAVSQESTSFMRLFLGFSKATRMSKRA
ncbi:GNAT family N-acetyltransferase [Lentibacter algarum]|uniref:GNAT family N-acetyltransferase n=1 Tax=Lentibacter algarum TaxID=576131 RepID=UPI001C08FD40|nr:GNAT family N-acetyltransferase [Lentibacter algarum]MBU2983111.1 GNAT family N-acetyltransferase [Lentibacter algarum]